MELDLGAIEKRLSEATAGPWKHESYPSGSEYVHMRFASCKDGLRVFGPDKSDQDGHVGAHMNLYNVPAFAALTGETADQLEKEKWANAEFIAHAREDVELLVGEVRRLRTELAKKG
jgi:hypothetical protein